MPARGIGKPLVDISGQHRLPFAIETELQHEWIRGMLIRRGGRKHKKRHCDEDAAKNRQRRTTKNPRITKSLTQPISAHCAPPEGFTFCRCSSNSFASE